MPCLCRFFLVPETDVDILPGEEKVAHVRHVAEKNKRLPRIRFITVSDER